VALTAATRPYEAGVPSAAVATEPGKAPARGRERWVINKLRALAAWFTKGLDNGSQLRVAINHAESIDELRNLICGFFVDVD
jgi:hypothetical protein